MAFMVAAVATDMQIFFLGAGAAACWAALRVKSRIQKETEGARSLLIQPVTLKWPMLGFDGWTLGITVLFVMLRSLA